MQEYYYGYLAKISFIIGLIIFGFAIFWMVQSGFLLELIMQYPFISFFLFGILLYSLGFLFDFIFFRHTRLYDINHIKFHLPTFLAIWVIVAGIIFMLLSPPLNLATIRIIFRRTPNCNAFENPTIYLCYTIGDNNNQLFYTTPSKQECLGDASNVTSFYITSLWIPPKHMFKLNKDIVFNPLRKDKETYKLFTGYCVQSGEHTISNDSHVKVAFYSWDKKNKKLEDTGFIRREDLDEFHGGWYKVSNCRFEFSYLLGDCITGYVSSVYVNIPEYMKSILHA